MSCLFQFFSRRSTIAKGGAVVIFFLTILTMSFRVSDAPVYQTCTAGSFSRTALVELFTSEGCSSCPAADALLPELRRDNVYVLEFHVDYWDRLGWKDPFSEALFSTRQKEYARQFALSSVYTPQAVVNGTSECVGSDRGRINKAIDHSLDGNISPTNNSSIEITVREAGRKISVDYTASGLSEGSQKTGDVVFLALVQLEAVSKIGAGENSGRTLKHVNIVRELRMEKNVKGTIVFELPDALSPEQTGVTAWVQEAANGSVKAVAASNGFKK